MVKYKFLFTASRASHIMNFHLPCIKKLRESGNIVEVVTEGIIPSELVDKSYDLTFKKKLYSPKNFDTIRKMSQLIRKREYDIIISNTTLAGIMTRLAIPILKKKKPYHIYICHGFLFNDDNSKKSRFYRMIEKTTASNINQLLVMNQVDFEIAKRYQFCENIHFINGMGVDTARFPEIEHEKINLFRNSIGANENDFVFLCVGEFSERKNQKLIINAFSELLQKSPNNVLLFAGNGEQLNEAKRLTEYKEISHKVHFLNQIEDINILYRASQAVVSASRSEGLPFNIMEALECGKPVIVSKIKGHTDLVTNNFNGFLFQDNNKENLLESMLKITNSEVYHSLENNLFLDKKYTSDEVTKTLISYYLPKFEKVSTSAV